MESGPKTILIALMVPVLLCCGGGYFLLSSAVDLKSRKAREFGDLVVQRVTTKKGWDAAALHSMGNAQYQKTYSVADVAKATDGPAQTLGTFVSGQGSVKISAAGDSKTGQGTTVEYQNRAKFTSGKAIVKIELAQNQDKSWAVTSFSIAPEKLDNP
ncbi:MAG: hypothetical protein ABUL72_00810 [Armatimonadota bacterium]